MSSVAASNPSNTPSTAASKNKKGKRRKAGKGKINGEVAKPNGVKPDDEPEHEDAEGEDQGSRTPTEPPSSPRKAEADHRQELKNGVSVEKMGLPENIGESGSEGGHDFEENSSSDPTGTAIAQNDAPNGSNIQTSAEAEARFQALVDERDSLREEVAQVRRALEEIQGKHDGDLATIREQLSETRSEKEQAEAQYKGLLGKVSTIRSQLGERLKADAEDLSQARGRIEDLEEQCGNLREQNEARAVELATLAEEGEQKSKELSGLRNRTTLSQQNWTKEREDLIQREAYAKEEFEAAKQAMQDWEILAMEERSIRESIAERVADLEEQVVSHREAHERAASERDTRKRELRELVENSQTQVENLSKKLKEFEHRAAEATTSLEATKQELERALPFEKEVKEKNLLIGKLRHEAVILNDHLTKALRYLKKGKPEDTIDKQLVTNHFLHFLALERADSKKFQVLQIIASLLAWTDEQREQAGLARPGTSNPNQRVPISPWHRTPSTPALSTDFFPDGATKKESLAELWSDFLEQEAQEGVSSLKSPPSSSGGSRPP